MTKAPSLTPVQAQVIADAVREIELSETEAWDGLEVLSANTHIEAIEVFDDEIRSAGTKSEGPIYVHVTVRYPGGVTLSETFPGRFEGTWKENHPSIDKIEVDKSSFTA